MFSRIVIVFWYGCGRGRKARRSQRPKLLTCAASPVSARSRGTNQGAPGGLGALFTSWYRYPLPLSSGIMELAGSFPFGL